MLLLNVSRNLEAEANPRPASTSGERTDPAVDASGRGSDKINRSHTFTAWHRRHTPIGPRGHRTIHQVLQQPSLEPEGTDRLHPFEQVRGCSLA